MLVNTRFREEKGKKGIHAVRLITSEFVLIFSNDIVGTGEKISNVLINSQLHPLDESL